jgi:Oxoglutarate and iron-dependent oxygenase degradation C-term
MRHAPTITAHARPLLHPTLETLKIRYLQVKDLLCSAPFRALLQRVTGLDITGRRAAARRFRPGLDYTLATPQRWDAGDDNLVLDAVLCFVGEFYLICM